MPKSRGRKGKVRHYAQPRVLPGDDRLPYKSAEEWALRVLSWKKPVLTIASWVDQDMGRSLTDIQRDLIHTYAEYVELIDEGFDAIKAFYTEHQAAFDDPSRPRLTPAQREQATRMTVALEEVQTTVTRLSHALVAEGLAYWPMSSPSSKRLIDGEYPE